MTRSVALIGGLLTLSACSVGLKITDPDAISDSQDDTGEVITLDSSDPPILDPVDRFRNDDQIVVTGLAPASGAVTLQISNGDGADYEYLVVADEDGLFEAELSLTRGVDTQIAAANDNGASDPVETRACAIWDAYEIEADYGEDYGDTCEENPVAVSDDFTDDGSLADITGNVLTDGDEDWYRVVSVDADATEQSLGFEDYNFEISFLEGADKYSMSIFRGSCASDSEECSGEDITEYSFFAEDVEPDKNGDVPNDPRACGSETTNECADFSATYYVVIRRTDGQLDCDHYRLRVQNGR